MTAPLATGTKLGRYEIRSLLGSGGMGEVYLAWDTELDRTVAIKILPESLASDHQKLRRFVQEAKAASALNHPQILTVHEIGTTGNTPFIASEFIDGETLRERINHGIRLAEILEVSIQVSGALAAAHAAGIIHRDIKPENIMIRRDGYIKVLDFGLAKLTELASTDTQAATRPMIDTREGVVMGTARYMSPEQAAGEKVDARSDLWSLGVVIYEMVSGEAPFNARTAAETLALVLQKQPAPLTHYSAEVPAELERIVTKALTKDRDDRYQTAKDLLIDLRNLKRKLEVDAEIDRTVPSELRGATSTVSGRTTPVKGRDTTRPLSSAEYIVSRISQHKVVTVFAAVLVIVGGVGLFLFLNARNAAAPIESVAVLPFENRSSESDTDYLSDGLAESVIYRLSQLPNLRVSPTSSVFRYKGKAIDPIQAGKELDVNAVLSGRIVQRGDNLTISAELVDVRYNKLLWGEQYERKMSELLQTQRQIASEIVDKLKLKVSSEEKGLAKHYTENNDAYQLYLKGRFYWNQRSPESLHKALDYYQQAIERDSKFALAYSGLAETYALLGGPEAGGDMAPNEALPKAKAAALTALQIDDTLAEPHVPLAHVTYFYDRDWAGAEREFKRAIEINPNYAIAHHWYAVYLSVIPGRQQQALVEIRRAMELEPLSLSINVWLGRILSLAGEQDQALEQLRKTVRMDSNFILGHYRLGSLFAEKGMYSEAISEFMEMKKLSGSKALAMTGLAYSYALSGKRDEAEKVLTELLQLSKQQYVAPGQIAYIYIALGDRDQAFKWLEESDKAHDLNVVRLKTDSRFQTLRSDPRYNELVRRIGIP